MIHSSFIFRLQKERIFFQIDWFVLVNQNTYAISFSDCAVTIIQPFGVITSPGFPQPYEIEIDCTWNVQLPIGQLIQLHFLHFDVQYYKNCL